MREARWVGNLGGFFNSLLNLIERLWNFVKKKCLYDKLYPSFKSFAESVIECLDKVGKSECEAELKSLLTLRFRKFSDFLLID